LIPTLILRFTEVHFYFSDSENVSPMANGLQVKTLTVQWKMQAGKILNPRVVSQEFIL
jgi:hypothetical protein